MESSVLVVVYLYIVTLILIFSCNFFRFIKTRTNVLGAANLHDRALQPQPHRQHGQAHQLSCIYYKIIMEVLSDPQNGILLDKLSLFFIYFFCTPTVSDNDYNQYAGALQVWFDSHSVCFYSHLARLVDVS